MRHLPSETKARLKRPPWRLDVKLAHTRIGTANADYQSSSVYLPLSTRPRSEPGHSEVVAFVTSPETQIAEA
jgi:hypothetical protein